MKRKDIYDNFKLNKNWSLSLYTDISGSWVLNVIFKLTVYLTSNCCYWCLLRWSVVFFTNKLLRPFVEILLVISLSLTFLFSITIPHIADYGAYLPIYKVADTTLWRQSVVCWRCFALFCWDILLLLAFSHTFLFLLTFGSVDPLSVICCGASTHQYDL